jgi:hypothetical protein
MKLFRRKGGANSRSGKSAPTHGNDARFVAHRLTQDLARAEDLATMLAKSRAASAIEVADLLAGMYLYDWERLGKYWDGEEQVETFLQHICQISPQRWHHWIEIYDRKRNEEEQTWAQRILGPLKKAKRTGDAPLERSTELRSVLKRAEEIAPHHDRLEGRTIPILTCECVLLCIAKNAESEISHRLLASGLDVLKLERNARFPKHAPLDSRD